MLKILLFLFYLRFLFKYANYEPGNFFDTFFMFIVVGRGKFNVWKHRNLAISFASICCLLQKQKGSI